MKMSLILLAIALLFSCNGNAQKTKKTPSRESFNVNKTDAEWKTKLTAEQYEILRNKGTERPHTGQYNLHFDEGTYHCAGCNAKLFESDQKFKSNCGWPSFDNAIKGSIIFKDDRSLGMIRTEIICANCGGHLGHIFDDGPTETGLRYCVNSTSLNFNKKE